MIQAYLREQQKSQTNNITLNLKEKKKKQIKPQISRRKEVTEFRAEIKNRDQKIKDQWN